MNTMAVAHRSWLGWINRRFSTGSYMPIVLKAEQRERMRSMRAFVKDFNVYRWAGHMLLDAVRLRKRERMGLRINSHHHAPLRGLE
jgi:trehalose-6-phosphate synthase